MVFPVIREPVNVVFQWFSCFGVESREKSASERGRHPTSKNLIKPVPGCGMVRVFHEGRELEAELLDEEKFEAIDSPLRREILERLQDTPSYPAEISDVLGVGKQRAYYHFNLLKNADLLKEVERKEKSGGEAIYYEPTVEALVYDTGSEGTPSAVPEASSEVESFLSPFVKDGKIDGRIVVGSSEPHGPDRVRARDGHLAGEIAAKLGRYGTVESDVTVLDTEKDLEEPENLLILGGVLTNTAAKKFNNCFEASFQDESFPYRGIETSEDLYDSDSIGVVAKASHPKNEDCCIYLVAGVRARGTRAAVKAFQELENLVEDYDGGEFYRVVRGLDEDGDGKVDSYEVVE